MAIFDQRNQKVSYQYNAAGDINFGAVKNNGDLLREFSKLRLEFDRAIQAGVFEQKIAVEVSYKLDKAVIEVQEPKPDKKTVENYLQEAKALIEGITAATGLVAGLVQAAELVRRLL